MLLFFSVEGLVCRGFNFNASGQRASSSSSDADDDSDKEAVVATKDLLVLCLLIFLTVHDRESAQKLVDEHSYWVTEDLHAIKEVVSVVFQRHCADDPEQKSFSRNVKFCAVKNISQMSKR